MTHDSAVRTVLNLVPEIEKRGASQVLTDYATKEDLPVAQLEKLAQVYNTLRTVSHIDHADESERGATVSLLDVPNLVVGYATGIGQEKAAHGPHSFSSHDISRVDLNRSLRRELGGVEKAASQASGAPSEVNANYKLAVDREQTSNALLLIEVDIEDEMAKLAGEIFAMSPLVGDSLFDRDISDAEEEALYHQPESAVKAAGDYMERFAAPHRSKLTRFTYDRPLAKRAYALEHALGEKFALLAKSAATLEVITKMATTIKEQQEIAGKSPDEDDPTLVLTQNPSGEVVETEISPAMQQWMLGGGPPPKVDKGKTDPERDGADEDDEAGGEGEEPPLSADDRLRAAEGLSASTDAPPAEGGAGPEQQEKGKSQSGKGSGGGTGDGAKTNAKPGVTGSDLLSAVAAPFAAAGSAVRGAATKADDMLSKVVSKERQNKAQLASDMSVEDIRRAMNVRRLIGTDPVLREADPKEVLEVYNSVAARNPEIAGDMAAMRLILREAVSYEGLTLDSQKLLTEIRRNAEQADEAADSNERRRYAVGGASPIQILKA